MLALALVIGGVISRIVIHSPNFTPVIAVALFSGVYLNKKYAAVVPLLLMIASDVILGFHDTILYTWGSVALISLIGLAVKKNMSRSWIWEFMPILIRRRTYKFHSITLEQANLLPP